MIVSPMFWKDIKAALKDPNHRLHRRQRAIDAVLKGGPLPDEFELVEVGRGMFMLEAKRKSRPKPKRGADPTAVTNALSFARVFVDYLGEQLGSERALAAMRLLSRVPELRALRPPNKRAAAQRRRQRR